MKRFVVAIAAVMGLAMSTGSDIAYARQGGGGSAHGGGGGHSRGASVHGSSGHGGHHGGHGGHHGGHGHYGGWYGGFYYAGLGYWGWPWYYGGYPYYGGYYAGYPYYAGYSYDPYPQSFYESAPAQSAPAPSLWHYCTDPAGYHPYVQKCNALWVPVVPPSATRSGKPEVRMQ